jgi:DNA-binding winged helix-turn-helix (wHTH) protein/Tol biopolymer transport system component
MTDNKCFVFRFDDVEVRDREFILTKAGEVLPIEPKAFRVLQYLLRNPQKLVTKDELLEAVWSDVSVSENSVARAIAQLRRLLGDDPREPRYILTVPTLGYRFLYEVAAREDGFGSGFATGATLPEGGNESEQSHGTDGAGDSPAGHPAEGLGILSGGLDEKGRVVSSSRKLRAHKLLFAWTAAALLLFVVVFVFRRLMGTSPTPTPNPPRLAMEERLTANPPDVPVTDAVVSPDGKYLAYADQTGLYLRQISNGETRPWSLSKDFLAFPRSWFPDGTHLLVARITRQSSDPNLSEPCLYSLSILGGEPQEIVSDARSGYVSPDGSRIAYLPTTKVDEMWIMDSDGANPRKVVSGRDAKKYGGYWSWIAPVAWSPDGKHLAYIENHIVAGPVEPIHSLRIIGSNGEGETEVLNDPRIGEAVWWAPGGRILLSYREDPSSRQNNYGVYSIRVDERTGKTAGPPQPVTQAEGRIGGMSGTTDGKWLILRRSNETPQVFIASRDAASHQWKEPRRLTLDANENIADTWTADSKAVLFVSNRNGMWKLFKQAIDETSAQVLAEGRSLATPRLSADGSQVIYLSSTNPDDISFPASLMSKPLAGGAPRVIIQGKGILNHQCARAPSTLCIFSQLDGQDLVLRSFDLEHGTGRELMRLSKFFGSWNLASDGSKLVIFLDPHRIRFVSLDTGAAHDVKVKDWPIYNGDWAENNQSVFMPSQTPDGLPVILEVDETGNAKNVLQGSANIGFGFLIQSPDARYGLLLEFIPSDSNAWIVKDF